MVKTPILFNKTLVIGIIIMLIGMSVVSSTEHTLKDSHTNYHPIESIDLSKEILSRGKIAYAYIAYSGSSGLPEGPCFFDLDNPGDLTSLIIENCPDFLCGTWTPDEKMLVCDETGSLWEIDLCYKTASEIGGGGTVFYGLTYNPVNEKLYGSTGYGLYEIDIDTGNPTYIGNFFIGTFMIDIACNIDGVCYGWDVLFSGTSMLYTIDLNTGEATVITDLGECINCVSSGSFDYETNTLYIAACSSSCGILIKIDFENGGSLIGNFEGCAYLSSLVIPYSDDFCPPYTTHSLYPSDPDGENGWYVSDITVSLIATDDKSGVKEIRYTINNGAEQVIPGSSGTFVLTQDGDDIVVKYWAIDNAGNVEPKNTIMPLIDMDQTPPEFTLEDFTNEIIGGNQWQGWELLFTANATDAMSGMNRVEFYVNNVLQETVYGSGPTYQWEFRYWGHLNIFISATAFDNAGNNITQVTYDNPHRQISHIQPMIKQQLLTLLFSRLIDRFPLLEVIILRAMNLLR